MRVLIINASQLLTLTGPDRPRAGREMSSLGLIRDGAVLIDEEGLIIASGPRDRVQKQAGERISYQLIDAGGRVVLPGFVDSHAHPVFSGPRLDDFERRIQGRSYADIAAMGGGILWTVNGVRGASEQSLADGLRAWARLFLQAGTSTLEAKSGYGLSLEDELKILRVIRAVGREGPLELIATFLGAHAVPPELKGRKDEYMRRVCEEMLPVVSREGLARFVDVFCDEGYFTPEHAERLFKAASQAGLGAKIHAEQLSLTGGSRLAVRAAACSADHLDHIDDAGVQALVGSRTVAGLVPGSNYFFNKPYPPARRLIDSGAAVALATDFNPGTCPCWDMRMILSIACTQMRMSPAEALVAATINGAWALGLGKTHGSLEPGRQADILCYEAEDYREIPYYFGRGSVAWLMKRGQLVYENATMASQSVRDGV
ncbi:MAG: imidazolonepropionase [Elusimicrobia bacterium]|nr:imidazolonepropionase [Elusimicrobiota bacterium]